MPIGCLRPTLREQRYNLNFKSKGNLMFKLFKNYVVELLVELSHNGKMLVGYLLMFFPYLNQYPMIAGALDKFAEYPTKESLMQLMVQVLLVFGAGARVVKILKAVSKRVF